MKTYICINCGNTQSKQKISCIMCGYEMINKKELNQPYKLRECDNYESNKPTD